MEKIAYIHTIVLNGPKEKEILCPFRGWEFDGTFESFVNILKEHCYQPETTDFAVKGYPALEVALFKDLVLRFCGAHHEYSAAPTNPYTNRKYRWCIFQKGSLEPLKWLDIEKDWDYVVKLFPSKQRQQAMIDAISELINKQGYIEIKIK